MIHFKAALIPCLYYVGHFAQMHRCMCSSKPHWTHPLAPFEVVLSPSHDVEPRYSRGVVPMWAREPGY